jgi:hypothetical protein
MFSTHCQRKKNTLKFDVFNFIKTTRSINKKIKSIDMLH